MEHQDLPIKSTSLTTTKTRRWNNQYIELITTKPDIIHTFKDRVISDDEQSKLQKVFLNFNRIFCELGCGAGSHLAAQADKDRSALFIGLELKFKRLFLSATKSENLNLSNVRILQLDAKQISRLFTPSQLDGVYINFPDPWADKRRWKKHRLINVNYISELYKLVKVGGFISYKTDHLHNFKETLRLFEQNSGFALQQVTDDLYNSKYKENNISSEFERLFVSKGLPIYYLSAIKI